MLCICQVKDLEIELETMKQTREESLQQAVINERERVTQVQWDMEELRRKCMEMELKLKSEQVEVLCISSQLLKILMLLSNK